MLVKPLIYLVLWGWLFGFSIAQAKEAHIVDHVDLITFDAQLSLADLINQTLEKYPDYALIAAMQQESEALQARGSRWISGAPQLQGYYKDDFVGANIGFYEFDGTLQVPVWNWGQRRAGLRLAKQAGKNVGRQVKAIKLKVAGLVREIVWLLKLEDVRYELAKKEFSLAERLMQTVQRRVDLGDLPRSDLLLAQNASLQKKVALVNQEAAVMHARKRYYFLTQTHKMPEQINEIQSTEKTINAAHPELAAMNAIIARRKAQVEWVKAKGSGQTTVAIGAVTESGSRHEKAINTITFSVNMPFGGSAFLAPKIAVANRKLVAAKTQKMHTYRALLAKLHEAEHSLEVELAQFEMTQQIRANAQEHLKMTEMSFNAGEINLMDFLRVQTQTYKTIKNAQESGIRLQRDIAFYNQAVGVMP